MTDPVPGVKYRIQSSDFLTYLELSDTLSSVGLRPKKETDRQYWQFVTVSGYTGYFVQNVANSNICLYYSSSYVIASSASTSYSLVNVSYKDGAYRLAFYYSYSNYYFYTTDNATKVYTTTSSQDLEQQRWQLIPATSQPAPEDVLQSGTYRIRNLNGTSLLTMPDGQSLGSTHVYVRSQFEQSDRSAYQRWTVTQQSSGQYIIQNAGNNSYLGCNVAVVVDLNLVGLQNMYPWDINHVGGFAWSLSIPATALSVGVADYEIEDGDEVNLIPSDKTSSQIWFMEKYFPLGEDKIYAKREVEEGTYLLRNAMDQTIYMNAFNTPWRISPGTAVTSKFNLKYIDNNSAHFTLTFVTTSKPAPIVADLGGYLGLAAKGTEFVLLEKDDGDPGYVICRPESGRPHKVVSGRATTDINQNAVFAIENMVVGDATQMWTLVST